MKTLTLNIPDNIDLEARDLLMMIAAHLYGKSKLSLGQAAEMAKLTKRTFAELLGKYDVPLFNYPASDLTTDIQNA